MTKERKEQEDRGEMEEGPGEESGERSRREKRKKKEVERVRRRVEWQGRRGRKEEGWWLHK